MKGITSFKSCVLHLILLLGVTLNAQHNHELYITGELHITEGAAVYVWGDTHIQDTNANLQNDGIIVIEGNLYKSDNASYTDNGIGTVILRNINVNTTDQQSICGSFYDTNSIANLIIDNKSADPFVSLHDGNLQITESLKIMRGILRTDSTSHPGKGSHYANQLHISNDAPNAIQIFGTNETARIEGKLSRNVQANKTYNFPISTANEQNQEYSLHITTAPPNANILTYFDDAQNTQPYHTLTCGDIDYIAEIATGKWYTIPSSDTGFQYDLHFAPDPIIQANHESLNNLLSIGNDTLAHSCFDSYPTDPSTYTATDLTELSYFELIGFSPLLPIQLQDLTAQANARSIDLKWITTTEKNHQQFDIERSTDATQFTKIATQQAQGAPNQTTHYIQNDPDVHPNITYYYRLKSISTDGTIEYSPIVSASLTNRTSTAHIYPNPITQYTQKLTLQAMTDSPLTIQIFDQTGRQVHHQKITATTGQNIQVPTQHLPNGIYTVHLTDHIYIRHAQLIIAR